MERIKNMSLKKSFFRLTLLFLLAAIILSAAVFVACISIRNTIDESNIEVQIGENAIIDTMPPSENTATHMLMLNILSVLQLGLPIVFIITALFLADIVFYRVKIRLPLNVLRTGAEQIMKNNLEFSIHCNSNDELGQLCIAFEAMRGELLQSNKELWRQMDERKRLNAAFSHDLRNPVTVLKGSAQMLKKGLPEDKARDTVQLIEEYANRIETYVEAMSNAQKLEEIDCSPVPLLWKSFIGEFCDSLSILGSGAGIDIKYDISGETENLWVDKSIALNVAENLLANAIRYAKAQIDISVSCSCATLTVTVQDDGYGFPDKILNKGAEPFLRGEETAGQTEHFGMGLYVCRLLCEKHGGTILLRNTEKGASVTATFSILNP